MFDAEREWLTTGGGGDDDGDNGVDDGLFCFAIAVVAAAFCQLSVSSSISWGSYDLP